MLKTPEIIHKSTDFWLSLESRDGSCCSGPHVLEDGYLESTSGTPLPHEDPPSSPQSENVNQFLSHPCCAPLLWSTSLSDLFRWHDFQCDLSWETCSNTHTPHSPGSLGTWSCELPLSFPSVAQRVTVSMAVLRALGQIHIQRLISAGYNSLQLTAYEALTSFFTIAAHESKSWTSKVLTQNHMTSCHVPDVSLKEKASERPHHTTRTHAT